MTEDEAIEAWKSAETFEQLCELTAKFIEGKSPFCPSYGGAADPETQSLVPYLAALNRSGFMTESSQPGEETESYKQRSYVDGYARETTAKQIARMSLYIDLHIVVYPVGQAIGSQTPVTVSDFHPFTWSGFFTGEEVEFYAQEFPNVQTILEPLWGVSVIDLVWGRQDYLWENLTRELCYSEVPHPNLMLDRDFIY